MLTFICPVSRSSRISVEDGEEDGDSFYTDYSPGSLGVYRLVFDDWEIMRQANRSNREEAREKDYDINLKYQVHKAGPGHQLTAEADFEFGSEEERSLLYTINQYSWSSRSCRLNVRYNFSSGENLEIIIFYSTTQKALIDCCIE